MRKLNVEALAKSLGEDERSSSNNSRRKRGRALVTKQSQTSRWMVPLFYARSTSRGKRKSACAFPDSYAPDTINVARPRNTGRTDTGNRYDPWKRAMPYRTIDGSVLYAWRHIRGECVYAYLLTYLLTPYIM